MEINLFHVAKLVLYVHMENVRMKIMIQLVYAMTMALTQMQVFVRQVKFVHMVFVMTMAMAMLFAIHLAVVNTDVFTENVLKKIKNLLVAIRVKKDSTVHSEHVEILIIFQPNAPYAKMILLVLMVLVDPILYHLLFAFNVIHYILVLMEVVD